ncbi:two-component sensor histidine kinase [Streptomyces sp. TRM66268-LWL]|uniref:histidine kinase n=1 Tax=Streptomyces polyasparticus TaxID=2767826 RepID=A0ABR7SEV8_9ACTN|nr:ATP-binding protein [Streptomyces polyasparticus]MBC9713127.1 two-component sensor histidine kinase [Streptomyces polyasparticus]
MNVKGWWAAGRWAGPVAGGFGGVSLMATAVVIAADGPTGPDVLAVVELGVLLALTAFAARWISGRRGMATTGLAAAAGPLSLLRRTPVTQALVAGVAFWLLLSLAAVGTGLYLRHLDRRRVRSVREAQREQRLRLAADLHDFVAHDVSEMLALAQAGQVLAVHDPAAGAAQLVAIEAATQRALSSLDRTVHVLHADGGAVGAGAGGGGAGAGGGGAAGTRAADGAVPGVPDAGRAPLPGLAELPDLVRRFDASSGADAVLDCPAEAADVSREVSMTAYRVVVEALTNVRRHARDATRVEVAVTGPGPHGLRVDVRDDGRLARTGFRRSGRTGGGRGLAGLTAQVRALGGELEARPAEDGGWHLRARLPVR